ncbi:MAG: hypothetical protein AAFR61_28150 [Bacteroidota bacterium]
MSELQAQILSLSPEKRLELIAFITESLKDDQLLKTAQQRSEKIASGEDKTLTFQELKERVYGKTF